MTAARKRNLEILGNEIWALRRFAADLDATDRANLLESTKALAEFTSSYAVDENFCWKNGRKEDKAIQAICSRIKEIIGLGNEDENNLCSAFDDITEMYETLGYYGDINRVEAILLGAYDGFDVRELVGDKYCPRELSL